MAASASYTESDILPSQWRAARALLDWSLDRLAFECGVTKRTLIRLEGGHGHARASTLAAMRAALEAAGIEFIEQNGGGEGVRMRLPRPE